MTQTHEKAVYQVIWLVRRLFRAFAQKSGQNLEAFGISVADRAVMEFLYPEEPLAKLLRNNRKKTAFAS